MKALHFVWACIALSACGAAGEGSARENTDTITPVSNAGYKPDADSSGPDAVYEGLVSDFGIDYRSSIHLDTTLQMAPPVRVMQLVDTSRRIGLPARLIFDGIPKWIYRSRIAIVSSRAPHDTLFIGSEQLRPMLLESRDSLLPVYGVPLNAAVSSAGWDSNTFNLKFSFSIPYTDLGRPIKLSVDTRKMIVTDIDVKHEGY